MKKKGLWFGILILLLLWPASAVLAEGPDIHLDEGQIFVDEDVSLEPGESFQGDLGVLNGDLYVPQDSVVDGDVFVTNGDAEIAGRIRGSLAIMSGDLVLRESGRVEGDTINLAGSGEIAGRIGGDLSIMFSDAELHSSAVVEGDLMVLSGTLERADGAQVLGEEMPDIRLPRVPIVPERPRVPEVPDLPDLPERLEVPVRPRVLPEPSFGQRIGDFVGRALSAGLLSLILVGLGLLVVLIWPRHTNRVAECIGHMPWQSFGLGLLTFLGAAVLEAFAAVLLILLVLVAAALISTVILIPIGLLLILLSFLVLLPVPLALAGGMILGWVALAEIVGRKIVSLLKGGAVKPLGAVFLGLLVTVSIAAFLWVLTPICCGWPFVILLTSMGLGAVFHTRFGRQPCQPSAGAPDMPDAEPLPAEAMDQEAGLPDGP